MNIEKLTTKNETHFGYKNHAAADEECKLLRGYGVTGAAHTAMIFGELYRHGGEWKFCAVGQGFEGGLGALAKNYGVNL